MRKCSYIMDITWEIRNSEVIEKDGGGMVCLNHQSAIDILGKLFNWSVNKTLFGLIIKSYLVNHIFYGQWYTLGSLSIITL